MSVPVNTKPNFFYSSKEYIATITDTDTLADGFHGTVILNKATALTLTMGAAANNSERPVTVINIGAGAGTVSDGSTIIVLNQGESCTLLCDGTGWYLQTGRVLLPNPEWADIFIALAGAKVPASSAPTWATYSTNLKSYTFGINDYVDLSTSEILHNWVEGTNIEIHVHFITNGANDGTERKVKYQAFYSWGDAEEVMSAEANFSEEKTIVASEADRTHHLLDIGEIVGTNYKIGSLLKMRFKRIAGTGTEPASDPFVEMIGIHYQINTLGSRTQSVK